MKRVAVSALLLWACAQDPSRVAGGSTDTDTGAKLTGLVLDASGKPAAGADVSLRPKSFLAEDPTLQDTTAARARVLERLSKRAASGPAASLATLRDARCDSAGRYTLDSVAPGEFVLEARLAGRSAARAVAVPKETSTLPQAALTLALSGAVAGKAILGDSLPGPVAVRILGLERAVPADTATGTFTLADLPAGTWTLHVSSPIPFMQPREMSLTVAAGTTVAAEAVSLAKRLKQDFVLEGGRVRIVGLDSTNPVILENGDYVNPVDGAWYWAKASLGSLDLRGIVATYGRDSGEAAVQANLARARNLVRLARLGGLREIPDPVAGSRRPLAAAPGARRRGDANEGAQLIVREARKATPEKPLVYVSSGSLTTAADALLLDPSIGDRLLVLGASHGGPNGADPAAIAWIAERARLVEWSRDYLWEDPAGPRRSPDVFTGDRFGETLKAHAIRADSSLVWSQAFYGDFGAAVQLFRGIWSGAAKVSLAGPPMQAVPAGDAAADFVDIPAVNTDWKLIHDEFHAAVTDAAAYHPHALPGLLEAEAWKTRAGAALDSAESGEGVVWDGAGAAAVYRVAVGAGGAYGLEVRYRSGAGARLKLTLDGEPLAGLDLAPAPGWETATLPMDLPAGTHGLRVEAEGGSCTLDWFRVTAVR